MAKRGLALRIQMHRRKLLGRERAGCKEGIGLWDDGFAEWVG